MKTLFVNLFAGPGTGKSSLCASIFSELKWRNINCEMALEYAKEIVWDENYRKLENQLYIFAKQHNRMLRLDGKVQVVITDSPLLLSIIYDKKNDEILRSLVRREFHKFTHMNFFLNRHKVYENAGRTQSFTEAKLLDAEILNLLDQDKVSYERIDALPENVDWMVQKILEKIA